MVAGPAKTIELRVDSLKSTYGMFSWSSQIKFQAKLGNGTVIDKNVSHASGVLLQDLNGCIAEGVLELLKDEKVRSYLAN